MKIILLGAPGSGKGTVSNSICKEYNLFHISTGDLFREALKKDDDFSKEIKSFVLTGAYVPDYITNKIAYDAIQQSKSSYNGYILDGYPRTINQADYLGELEKIDCVILLDVDTDTLIKRIAGRRICLSCNTIYNIYFHNKPEVDNLCDKCKTELTQRKDDNLEIAKDRINLYINQTESLISYYENKGKLVKVDANVGVDNLLVEIRKILNKFI